MVAERVNRKLAAILAADVVGYSRLMGADEAGMLAALKRHREAVFDPAVAAHNGRIVKLIGDGVIAEFGSVVDAVSCALSVQRSSATIPDQGASQPTIVLRIGINLGDVIIEGDDIYGDGVNVAARLEPLAEPGGICVSSIVNESVGNRIDVRFKGNRAEPHFTALGRNRYGRRSKRLYAEQSVVRRLGDGPNPTSYRYGRKSKRSCAKEPVARRLGDCQPPADRPSS